MAIQNPNKVAARQRRRHPKAFADMDEVRRFREFQLAESTRFKTPKYRIRFKQPPVMPQKKP